MYTIEIKNNEEDTRCVYFYEEGTGLVKVAPRNFHNVINAFVKKVGLDNIKFDMEDKSQAILHDHLAKVLSGKVSEPSKPSERVDTTHFTNEIKSAFDTTSPAFREMMLIIGSRWFFGAEEGTELHHIVPVTWFAQTATDRPNWCPVHDFNSLIRGCKGHPANNQNNLVYLSKDEHNRVHELMHECYKGEWEAPAKGAGNTYPPIDNVLMKDIQGNVVKLFKSLKAAADYACDNGLTRSKSADWDLRWYINHPDGKTHWGYIWERA